MSDYKQVLRSWADRQGQHKVRQKCIEELSELIRALARGDDFENIAEELADVRICCMQTEHALTKECEELPELIQESFNETILELHKKLLMDAHNKEAELADEVAG